MHEGEGEASEPPKHPKFTFEKKEYFDQALKLTSKGPHWKNDEENPIYTYVPGRSGNVEEWHAK